MFFFSNFFLSKCVPFCVIMLAVLVTLISCLSTSSPRKAALKLPTCFCTVSVSFTHEPFQLFLRRTLPTTYQLNPSLATRSLLTVFNRNIVCQPLVPEPIGHKLTFHMTRSVHKRVTRGRPGSVSDWLAMETEHSFSFSIS